MAIASRGARRVLLTGAAGFIGSHLARQLIAEGHDVTAILRPTDDRSRIGDLIAQMSIVEGDLADLPTIMEPLRNSQPEMCIHLAWQGWKGRATDNVASLAASLNLLRAMPELQCQRFISAGTCYEYDLCDTRLAEDHPLSPREVYGSCKKALFEVGQQFGAETGISVAVPRIFYTYGPGEPRQGLVPYIILSLLRGDAAKLTRGDQVRDYVYAEDIASAIWAVATSDVRGAVNIASGHPVTVAHIARTLGELLEKPELIQLGAIDYRGSEPVRVLGDATRLHDEVKWTPAFDLDAGLTNAVAWWKEHGHI